MLALIRSMASSGVSGGRDGILVRYTNDYPLGAALNDHPEDAFLGATDPRPGRQMERDHFRSNRCIMRLKSAGPESAFIAAGKVDRSGPPGKK